MRRWLRRQDSFTRGLLVAVAALSVLVVSLIVSRPDGDRPEQRRSKAAPAPTKPPAAAARRRPGPAETALRPSPAPRAATVPAPPRPGSSSSRPAGRAAAVAPAAPRLAIVIDDLGQSISHLEQLAGLDIPLSVAVIPGLPASSRTVREAARRGIELLLHQPMEPREEGGKNPGAGVLLTSMSAEAVRARLHEGLAAVPGAVGVNNHMGSRFTEDAAALGIVLAELRERNLFWLDSRTTAATRGPEVARSLGVAALERDVFIDAELNVEFIRGQVRKLVDTARLRGAAVGIGHPHPETIAVLRELRGELLASGVTLVPVSALVHPAPPAGAAALAATGRGAGSGGAAERGPESGTP